MPKKSRNIVRLIGGKLRRRQISFPDAQGLRPTPDRVRETLFNWLEQNLTGKICLDLFAGSGALGFEAASRHAAHVEMVELVRPVYTMLQQNCRMLGLQDAVSLHNQSALSYLAQNQTAFDVIFLDPPFHSGLLAEVLPLLKQAVTTHGVVYVESAQWPDLPAGGRWLKQGKAGEVHFGLMTFSP